MLNPKEFETLTHKLYKTLTVLPLSSLLTEDNLKTVSFKTTHNIVEKADGTTYVNTKYANVYHKRIKDICTYVNPLEFTPILVNQRVDGAYYIVDGWHRLLAAKSMGWATIPCFVLQIPCGDEYVKDVGDDEWECNGGFLDDSDITIALWHGLDDLLKVLD